MVCSPSLAKYHATEMTAIIIRFPHLAVVILCQLWLSTVKVTSAEVFPFLVAIHGTLVVLDLLKQLPSLPAQNRGGLLPSHTS